MPTFSYKAIGNDGEQVAGTLEAPSQAEAFRNLTAGGLVVFEVLDTASAVSTPWYRLELFQNTTLGDEELAGLSHVMSLMLRQQMTLLETLETSASSLRNRKAANAIRLVSEGLRAGEKPDQAFRRAAGHFPKDFIDMIEAGARSNTLPDGLSSASALYGSRAEQRRKIVSAIAYPVFLIGASVLVFVIILQTLVPALHDTLSSSNGETSGSIGILFRLSEFVDATWPALLAMAALTGTATFLFRNTVIARLSHYLPFVRQYVSELTYAGVARQLMLSLRTGQTLEGALSSIVEGREQKSGIAPVSDAVGRLRQGKDAAHAFASDAGVPRAFSQLFEIGERSNNLASVMEVAGDTLEASSARLMQRFTGVLTPVLTLIVGGLIALLVQILMTAVLEVSQVAV